MTEAKNVEIRVLKGKVNEKESQLRFVAGAIALIAVLLLIVLATPQKSCIDQGQPIDCSLIQG